MLVRVFEELVSVVGDDVMKKTLPGADLDRLRWEAYVEVDLVRLSKERCEALEKLARENRDTRGTPSLIRDLETWHKARSGKRVPRPRNLKQAEALVRERIRAAAGHRLFKHDPDRDVWTCFYVDKTVYHPPRRQSDYTEPAYFEIFLVWNEFGGIQTTTETFYAQDVRKKNDLEILADRGYVLETDDLRKAYLEERERFTNIATKLGKQFWAKGTATDDLDGNNDERRDYWWYNRTNTIQLDKDGESTRVVIDVFQEADKEAKRAYGLRKAEFDHFFWTTKLTDWDEEVDDGEPDLEEDILEEGELSEEGETQIEIPIHPMLATFDMKRHMRLRIHVQQLTEYEYDPALGGKLILPTEERDLVEVLLSGAGDFKDIVKGKGGGAVILCAGPPGTGKTLTAEVYAEVMERPLYTVQCSQLGLSPEDLESELLKTFARSARWGAILLLDEADVYVSERGRDLKQNAIVGVFLRTLEYYKGVLFLTTNRSDLVDDAIASRCVARIDYTVPTLENQVKIWHVLAETAGAAISAETIQEVKDLLPKLTGRDVKNLLKLAMMVSDAKGIEIDTDLIMFVKRFKPTR